VEAPGSAASLHWVKGGAGAWEAVEAEADVGCAGPWQRHCLWLHHQVWKVLMMAMVMPPREVRGYGVCVQLQGTDERQVHAQIHAHAGGLGCRHHQGRALVQCH